MSWLDDIRNRISGAARSVDVQTLLAELAKLEHEFAVVHGKTIVLLGVGALSRAAYDDWFRQRDAVFGIQTEIYRSILSVLERLPGNQSSQIPAPQRWPDLPPFTGGQRPRELPTSTAGLGVAPVIIWAAVVVGVLTRLALIYAVVRVIQMGFDTASRLYAARQNTRRYQLEVDSQLTRFNRCIAAGGTPASCGALFPTPEPPIEQAPPERDDPVVWGVSIAAGVVSLGVIAYLFYEFATPGRWNSYSSTPTRVRDVKGSPRRLSDGEVSRALRGGR